MLMHLVQIYLIVQSLLQPSSNTSVLKIGLGHVASIMHLHEPLQNLFFSIVLDDSAIRTFLLNPSSGPDVSVWQLHIIGQLPIIIVKQVPEGVLGPIEASPVGTVWNRLSATKWIAAKTSGEIVKNEHLQLLMHCWGGSAPIDDGEVREWNTTLERLLQQTLAVTTDRSLASDAFALLQTLFDDDRLLPVASKVSRTMEYRCYEIMMQIQMFAGGESAPAFEPLRKILMNEDELCREEALRLIEKAFECHNELQPAIAGLVSTILERVPDSRTAKELSALIHSTTATQNVSP
jgi:hypothetical protein